MMNQVFKKDLLEVRVFETRREMGADAAGETAKKLRELLKEKKYVNMIFAAAPSQNEFLEALVREENIEWERVNAFHMDEYIGLAENHPQRFGSFLKRKIFEKLPFHEIHYLNGSSPDPEDECRRYSELLNANPVDIVCMGIGENTHIAFNDPYVANFRDPLMVKIVVLQEASRQQQVHDKCFDSMDDVPGRAMTLTVPALLQAKYVYCVVPGKNKTGAVFHTLNEDISEKYPSTSLRKHSGAILFLDKESAGKIHRHYPGNNDQSLKIYRTGDLRNSEKHFEKDKASCHK